MEDDLSVLGDWTRSGLALFFDYSKPRWPDTGLGAPSATINTINHLQPKRMRKEKFNGIRYCR
jgi:hypothetical protein